MCGLFIQHKKNTLNERHTASQVSQSTQYCMYGYSSAKAWTADMICILRNVKHQSPNAGNSILFSSGEGGILILHFPPDVGMAMDKNGHVQSSREDLSPIN